MAFNFAAACDWLWLAYTDAASFMEALRRLWDGSRSHQLSACCKRRSRLKRRTRSSAVSCLELAVNTALTLHLTDLSTCRTSKRRQAFHGSSIRGGLTRADRSFRSFPHNFGSISRPCCQKGHLHRLRHCLDICKIIQYLLDTFLIYSASIATWDLLELRQLHESKQVLHPSVSLSVSPAYGGGAPRNLARTVPEFEQRCCILRYFAPSCYFRF